MNYKLAPDKNIIVKPHVISNNFDKLPKQDLIILATKSSSLKHFPEVKNICHEDTLIMLHINGVNISEQLAVFSQKTK